MEKRDVISLLDRDDDFDFRTLAFLFLCSMIETLILTERDSIQLGRRFTRLRETLIMIGGP